MELSLNSPFLLFYLLSRLRFSQVLIFGRYEPFLMEPFSILRLEYIYNILINFKQFGIRLIELIDIFI